MIDLHETLTQKRAELEAEMASLTARPADMEGISFGKRVGDGTSQAVERISQVAAHNRLAAMLSDVRRAEAKLAQGTYGLCDLCGAELSAERLGALPWAIKCRACASH
jgi:DnaK suppressor protein